MQGRFPKNLSEVQIESMKSKNPNVSTIQQMIKIKRHQSSSLRILYHTDCTTRVDDQYGNFLFGHIPQNYFLTKIANNTIINNLLSVKFIICQLFNHIIYSKKSISIPKQKLRNIAYFIKELFKFCPGKV